MVITVTLNPAMDKTISIDNFSLGKVNRAGSVRYDIGGKGINVSKVLKNFGIDSKCTGFLGGIWADKFKKELNKRNIKNDFLEIAEDTRTNVKVVDYVNNIFTDINEPGPVITEEDLNIFIDNFKKICSSRDIVVLSGGVSPSLPRDIYKTLTEIAKGKGAFVILDADGELLEQGIKAEPNIIKPNENEFKLLLGKDLSSKEEFIEAAKGVIKNGVEEVLISLGEKGALYITREGNYYGQGLKVPVKSTVGAGDSVVAALIYSRLKGFNKAETLKFAIACGGAAVSTEGTEACTLEDTNALLKKVNIKNI